MTVYNLIAESGVVVADTSEILAETQKVYKDTYGQDFEVSPTSPQGQVVTAMALVKVGVAQNTAALANQINPNMAGGVALDAIYALTGGKRTQLEHSFVLLSCVGDTGTTVVRGSEVQDDQENVYITQSAVQLITGEISKVWAMAAIAGPVQSGVGTVTTIDTRTIGWVSVTNDESAIVGSFEQSDASVRTERNQTLALQSSKTMEAIFSKVRAVKGVKSLSARVNFESSVVTIDGIVMAPNSVWVCVYGGADEDIFQALYGTQMSGQTWTGDEVGSIKDEWSGQSITIKFDRPTIVRLYARVTVSSNSPVGDPKAAVRGALLKYSIGDTGTAAGFVVGVDVSSFEMAGAITIEVPDIFTKLLETSSDGTSYTSGLQPIGLREVATLSSGDIQVNEV